jgi:hypothetical protein
MTPDAGGHKAHVLDKTKATERARGYVAGMDPSIGLVEDGTQEEPFGWVFFYKHPSETLARNSPFGVFRDAGAIPGDRYRKTG